MFLAEFNIFILKQQAENDLLFRKRGDGALRIDNC